MKGKPLTKTELKHLVYLHVKRDSMTYADAVERVKRLTEELAQTHSKALESKKLTPISFAQSFKELKARRSANDS